jgi:hypothetical protein
MTYINSQVIKLYKIIQQNEADNFNNKFIEKLLCELNSFSVSEIHHQLNYIEINYSSKNWKSLSSFLKYLEIKKNKEIVYLHTLNSSINITYSNYLLNQTKREDVGYIEIIITIAQEKFSENSLIFLVKNIYDLLEIDYGYSFRLEENQDILTEIIEKKHNFIKRIFFNQTKVGIENLEKWNERKLKLLEVKKGIIPKTYAFNFWNKTQWGKIENKENFKPIFEISSDMILTQQE